MFFVVAAFLIFTSPHTHKQHTLCRASAERENEDISLRRIQAQGAEERRRTLEAITAVFTHLGSGGAALLGDPRKLVGWWRKR
jgi:hypothetical protein